MKNFDYAITKKTKHKFRIPCIEWIDICRCPEVSFVTTGYEKHDRERICMKCWLDYCLRNGIEIDYEN